MRGPEQRRHPGGGPAVLDVPLGIRALDGLSIQEWTQEILRLDPVLEWDEHPPGRADERADPAGTAHQAPAQVHAVYAQGQPLDRLENDRAAQIAWLRRDEAFMPSENRREPFQRKGLRQVGTDNLLGGETPRGLAGNPIGEGGGVGG